MKKIKRLLALLIACAVCIFGTSFVYAEEVTDVPEESIGAIEGGIMPLSNYNNILTLASTTFSWDGECSCLLDWRASNAGIKARISSNDSVGTVDCYVKLPSGSIQWLGTVPSSGGTTRVVEYSSLASGTYTFIFESSNGASLYGVGYIVQ